MFSQVFKVSKGRREEDKKLRRGKVLQEEANVEEIISVWRKEKKSTYCEY